MSTLAPPNLYKMYGLLSPHLSSLRQGGIVGDTAHVKGGGYHISRQDLSNHGQGGDYSIQAPADKDGEAYYADAIDISLNTTEMVLVSKRLKAAMEGVNYDPRAEPLREFIGTVDNKNVCGYNRYQTVYPNGSKGRPVGFYASGYSESSHLWHVHLSYFRRYGNIWNDILGVSEIVCGLKVGALGWKDPSGGTKPTPVPNHNPSPKPKPAPKVPKGSFLVKAGPHRGGIYKSPKTVDHTRINSHRQRFKDGKNPWFSKDTWFLQHWLNLAGEHYGTPTGYWDAKTQQLMDSFRAANGYVGGDAKGTVGVNSLNDLRKKAHAIKKVS